MTIASKRKPTIPCEMCAHYKPSRHDGIMMCSKLLRRVTEYDGCTFGAIDAR